MKNFLKIFEKALAGFNFHSYKEIENFSEGCKMKKIVSLLLTAVLLAAMLTVFAVPASAEQLVINGRRELGSGSYDDILINFDAELVISGDVKLERQRTEPLIAFGKYSKLTVKNGCRLTGKNVQTVLAGFNHKIKIEDGGKIEITFGNDTFAKRFASVLNNSGIPFKIEDNTIIAPYGNWGASWDGDGYYLIRNVSTGNVFDVAGGNDTSNYKKGTAVGPWYPNYQQNQIFRIKKIDYEGKALISPMYEGNGVLYVNAYGGAGENVELKLWHDETSIDSQWYLEEQGDGKYKIRSGNRSWYVCDDGGKLKLTNEDSATLFEIQKIENPTGSTISEGNVWIIAAIGAVAVISLAVIIAKKKKKAAAETTEETAETEQKEEE